MLVSIEATEDPRLFRVTFDNGASVIVVSSPRSCGYFNEQDRK